MEITYRTALEIVTHEGIARQAYRDSVGKWTWSVGLTNASGHNVERYIGKPQPMEHCLSVFVWALRKYAKDVEEAFAPIVLNEHQFAAALSFHWNTGSIREATWVALFKDGNRVAARKAFMNWKRPPQIIPRRRKERDLFFNGTWWGTGRVLEYRVGANGRLGPAKAVDISKPLARALKGEVELPGRKPGWVKALVGLIAALAAALAAYLGWGS